MKTNDIIKLKNIVLRSFRNSAKSVYLVESQLSSVLSDLDILCFFDEFNPSDICHILKTFMHNLEQTFRNRTIYIRYSTSSFFEPISVAYDNDPIVLDLLLLKVYRDTIFQLGFESGIIVSLVRKGKLILGKPIDLNTFKNINRTESSIALKHYFQHNVSKLIELSYNFKSPYYVILNSTKILSFAVYKYLRFTTTDFDKTYLNKLDAFKDICRYLPDIEKHIKFVQKYFNIHPTDLSFNDAQMVYENCFLAVSKIFQSFINKLKGDYV